MPENAGAKRMCPSNGTNSTTTCDHATEIMTEVCPFNGTPRPRSNNKNTRALIAQCVIDSVPAYALFSYQ